MKSRSARVVRLSAALLSLTLVGHALAQAPANPGRQLERQILNNAANALTGQPGTVTGQPGAVIGQPGAVAPGQPGSYGVPATPRQVLQGMERQAINNITGQPGSPATSGQRYQLPPQFAGSAPGTTINYAGANYVVNADRTMSPAAAAAQPAAVQPTPAAARYLIPAELAGNGAGSTVSYGGANYLINNDNTMSPATR
jgi:hypothetical protein